MGYYAMAVRLTRLERQHKIVRAMGRAGDLLNELQVVAGPVHFSRAEVAYYCGITSSTYLHHHLAELEQSGLVAIHLVPYAGDRFARRYGLTSKGRKYYRYLEEVPF